MSFLMHILSWKILHQRYLNKENQEESSLNLLKKLQDPDHIECDGEKLPGVKTETLTEEGNRSG